MMMRIFHLREKNETRKHDEVTKAIHEVFIRRKEVEHTSQVFWIFFLIGKKLKLSISDFLFKDNPKRLKFENTSVSWLEDKYIMDVRLFGKSSHPSFILAWIEFYIDWSNTIHAKGKTTAPNKPFSKKPLHNSRNHAYIFLDSTRAMKNSVTVTYDLAIAKFTKKRKEKPLVYIRKYP